MTTILLSSRHTEDNQAIWRAAVRRNWDVIRITGIRLPRITDGDVVIYLEALFAPTIAELLGCQLLDCSEDWLAKLPWHLKGRKIELTTARAARTVSVPMFVKPPNDKSFPASVYQTGRELPDYVNDDSPVLLSEPVEWVTEFRCFCLDGKVATCSPYLRSEVLAKESNYAATPEELAAASEFAETVLKSEGVITPRAIVLDVGQLVGDRWAVVETNGAWGAGLYGCDPDAALEVIRLATSQRSR